MKRTLATVTTLLALLPTGAGAADLLVDHVEYIRAAGVAQQISLFFPGCDPQGTYTLTLKNGQDEAHRAASGSVSVNGVAIVGAADFAQTPAPTVITKTIANVVERNTLELSITAPIPGSVIGWQVTGEVNCPDIVITSPTVGENFNRREITVSGKVRHRTPEVGVIVNGVLAQVNGNDWVASDVSLATGANTLTATVVDEGAQTASISSVVNRSEVLVNGIRIQPFPPAGVAPLQVSFTSENLSGKTLVQYAIDYGDGATETRNNFESVQHTYISEGVFQTTVTATAIDGATHRVSAAVSAHPIPPLRTRWEKMKAAIAGDDIPGALGNFTLQEARTQQRIFEDLGASALTMVANMQDIQQVYLQGDRAKFRIRRPELVDGVETPITYYIYFVRDHNGFWKIDSF
jgi:hypothetical protein